MKKLLFRGLVVLVVLLVIAVIVVGLTLDSAIKKSVETFGPQLTRVSVKLDGVNISILSGSGSIKGLVVGNPDGFKTPSSISVGKASLGLSPGSLLSDKIVIKRLHLESPEITFESGLKESNLSKLMDNLNAAAGGSEQKPAEQPAAGPGRKLQVDDFLLKGAKVNVSLTGMGGKVVPVPIPDIHFTNLGTGPEGITAAELTTKVFREILAEATKAATSDTVKNLGKEAAETVKDAGKKATDTVKGVTDLFKKK